HRVRAVHARGRRRGEHPRRTVVVGSAGPQGVWPSRARGTMSVWSTGTGRVILVGAGPGDPELLTLRGARALAEADLVLYDALVDPRMLQMAPRAQRFFVGKRAARPSISQSTICALLVRGACRGRVVVRLKAGDPF